MARELLAPAISPSVERKTTRPRLTLKARRRQAKPICIYDTPVSANRYTRTERFIWAFDSLRRSAAIGSWNDAPGATKYCPPRSRSARSQRPGTLRNRSASSDFLLILSSLIEKYVYLLYGSRRLARVPGRS